MNPEDRGMIENGWFNETAPMWPGQKFSSALENFSKDSIMFHKKSKFQDIMVFRSAQYRKVLIVDVIL